MVVSVAQNLRGVGQNYVLHSNLYYNIGRVVISLIGNEENRLARCKRED